MPRPKKVAFTPTPAKRVDPRSIQPPVKELRNSPTANTLYDPSVRLPVNKPYEEKPKRTPRPTPPAPEPPNPHVLELQGQIIKLVNMREALQAREAEATDTAAVAQAQLQSARSSLQRVESEVNYRIELIAKLTGVPTPRFAHISEVAHYPDADPSQGLFAVHTSLPAMPSGIGSVGSIPPSRPMVGGGPEGNVRMDSAEDIRRSL